MPRWPTIWERMDTDGPNGCWVWTGYVNHHGYGILNRKPKQSAHRLIYELLVGPIPDGLDLDHLCRNRRCVNPAHLEPVTRRENLLRGETLPAKFVVRSECVRGHSFTAENLKKPRGRGRECRQCDLDRKRKAG